MERFSKILEEKNQLTMIFSTRKVNCSKFLQQLASIINNNFRTLILDVNRTWSSKSVPSNAHIIVPKSQDTLFDSLFDLELLNLEKLDLIIIDNLPVYFRDYHEGSHYGIQNLRSFAFALAILSRIKSDVHVLISNYSHGIDITKPFMEDISIYYCDSLYHLEFENRYNLLEFTQEYSSES